jgi:hypothetical protein
MNQNFKLEFSSMDIAQILTTNDIFETNFDEILMLFNLSLKILMKISRQIFFYELKILKRESFLVGLMKLVLLIKIIIENNEKILKFAYEILYLSIHIEPDLIPKMSNDIFRRFIVQILSSPGDIM